MDPVEVLQGFDRAMAGGDRAAVAELADALVGWLEKSGFSPIGPYAPDWRGKLTPRQLASYFRAVRQVAEMA
jgi:hypothetical protein